MPLSEQQRAALLDTAWRSIRHGLAHGTPLHVDPAKFDHALTGNGASFVTLHAQGVLRGCIGSLEAFRPLVNDVAENAFAAAFRDPRFAPVEQAEMGNIKLDISVLGKPEALEFSSQQDLLEQIRPGLDGLILKDGPRRGTFLPSVWESLPAREDFLRQLKLKAGLPPGHWSDTLEVWRYTTECFGD
ncbi:MAG: AmmeMemoRadiSam system protein A [Thiogranum sp.]